MAERYVNTFKIHLRRISKDSAKALIVKNHYTHHFSSCRYALGVFYEGAPPNMFFEGVSDKLIGCLTYGHPVSNRAIDSIANGLELDNVLELTRLWIADGYGSNIESYAISQSFWWLKKNAPEVKVLISYADPEQGHTGTIYRATNWLYQGCGYSKLMPDYSIKLTESGDWIHSRTVAAKWGHKAPESLAKKIGKTFWRKEETSKHRYLYFLCDKKERKNLTGKLKIPIFPYSEIKEYTPLIQKIIVQNGLIQEIINEQGSGDGKWTNNQKVMING